MKKLLLIIGCVGLFMIGCASPRVITLNYPLGLAQRYENRGTMLIDQKFIVDHRPANERQNLTHNLGGEYLEYSQIQGMPGFLTEAFVTDMRNSGIFHISSDTFGSDYYLKIKLIKCLDLMIEFEVNVLDLKKRKAVFAETITKRINIDDPTIDLSPELIPMYQAAVIKMAVIEAIDKMGNKISKKKRGLPPAPGKISR